MFITTFQQRLALLVALIACTAVLITGCGEDDPDGCLPGLLEAPDALVIAVGTHQGAPRPGLPASAIPLVQSTLLAGHPVHVVGIDGTPEVLPVRTTAINDNNCNALISTLNRATADLAATITNAPIDSDGNALVEGIDLAAAKARSATGKGAVLVMDSGLADRGPLDYSREGMTLADPDEAAAYVATTSPLDLAGVDFTLMLGYTAAPQEPLSGAERANVSTTWATTLTALGADSVIILDEPRPNEGPETNHIVNLAPVTTTGPFTPPVDQATTSVLTAQQLSFHSNSTELIDPAAADEALADDVAWLISEPTGTLTITGTTSSAGTEAGRLELSRDRAETIKRQILESYPLHPSRIATEGVGTHFPGFVDDRDPDGSLNALAAANRTIRITAHPPTTR